MVYYTSRGLNKHSDMEFLFDSYLPDFTIIILFLIIFSSLISTISRFFPFNLSLLGYILYYFCQSLFVLSFKYESLSYLVAMDLLQY